MKFTFTPLASSSRGNCYILEAEGFSPLLLEAGIPAKQIREHLYKRNISLTDLAGCLISHEHGDHAKAVKDLIKSGVDCLMSKETAKALDVFDHHRIIALGSLQPQQWGPWRILPFDLEHDVPCSGFFISTGSERLLFVPDTGYIKNRFQNINILAVECNYISDILSSNIQKGSLPAVVGHRTRRNHMSLETLISMLKANDLSQCRQIFLLHLSDGNSDEARMIKAVQEATGVPVYVC